MDGVDVDVDVDQPAATLSALGTWDTVDVMKETAEAHHRAAAKLEALAVGSQGDDRSDLLARAAAERAAGDEASARAAALRRRLQS